MRIAPAGVDGARQRAWGGLTLGGGPWAIGRDIWSGAGRCLAKATTIHDIH
jgi:hypothetical protein